MNTPAYLRELCGHLEQGEILVLIDTPFAPSSEDAEFLRTRRQSAARTHKNIAFKPQRGKVTGVAAFSEEEQARLAAIMESYSRGALKFLSDLFPHYASGWTVDYSSFRPFEEEGRPLPLSRRNDLMHIDAFPTRPTNGGRLLRAFTNIHPDKERIWATADPFDKLAERYAMSAGLRAVTGSGAKLKRQVRKAAQAFGMKTPDRSPYDEFMIRFHHYLKSNEEFQRSGERERIPFPPGATWISFTDQIAHAVRSGQYALEQTCIVPIETMLDPARAPIAVLERLAGMKLGPANMSGPSPVESANRVRA